MSTTGSIPKPDQPAAPPSETAPAAQEAEAALSRIGHAWWLVLLLGLISVIVGGLVLWQPFDAVRVAAIFFGLWLLISGIFQLAQSFDKRLETTARVLGAISGLLGIILGIICFDSVEDRISLLVLFIGLWWIVRGVLQLVIGASDTGNGFVIFLGLLGIMAGIVVLVWPIASLEVLTVMAGIWLVVLGLFEILASLRIRSINNKETASAG